MYLAKKILIYILVIFSALPIFYGGNINKARADDVTYKPDPAKEWEIPANTDESTWSPNHIDSGSSMFIACPAPNTINNATLSGNQFQMTIPYQITFTPEDHEYIYQTVLAVADFTDGIWENIDLNHKDYTYLNDSFNYTFTLDHEYWFSVVIVVNSNTWYSIETTNNWRESNVCQLLGASDPTETIGGNASKASTEYDVHDSDKCEKKCEVGWWASHFTIGGAIENAICKMQCALINWEGEILSYMVKCVLMPALGLGYGSCHPSNTGNPSSPTGEGGGFSSGGGGGGGGGSSGAR